MLPTVLFGGHRGPLIGFPALFPLTAMASLVSRAAPPSATVASTPPVEAAAQSNAPSKPTVAESTVAAFAILVSRFRRRQSLAPEAPPSHPSPLPVAPADLDLIVAAAREKAALTRSGPRPRWLRRDDGDDDADAATSPAVVPVPGWNDDWDAAPRRGEDGTPGG